MTVHSRVRDGGDEIQHEDYNKIRKDILQAAGEYLSSTGSSNAFVLQIDTNEDGANNGEAFSSILEGHLFVFKANHTVSDVLNNSPTLEIKDSAGTTTILAATTIKDPYNEDLQDQDIQNGQIVAMYYNGTAFQLVTPVERQNSGLFGDGSDGDVTITSGTTTLTQDMFYDNLTLNDGAILKPDGYRVFVKSTLKRLGTGKFQYNGANGSNGTNGGNAATAAGTGGAGGAQQGSGPFRGKAGATGGNGGVGASPGSGASGSSGGAGDSADKSLGSVGVAGGIGGNGGNGGGAGGGSGGAAGTAGSKTGTIYNQANHPNHAVRMADDYPSLGLFTGSAGSGGGGGGGGGGAQATHNAQGGSGGGGGGAGSTGGVIAVYARHIIATNTNTLFEAIGGNGGNGGDGGNGADAGVPNNAGGGGGGAAGGSGGSGGVVVCMHTSIDQTFSSLYDLSGGTAGSGGTGGTGSGTGISATDGQDGGSGNAGSAGVAYNIVL